MDSPMDPRMVNALDNPIDYSDHIAGYAMISAVEPEWPTL